MDQSSKNKTFSAKDIERYHSGKMPAEERHALEKAALDDPFLADALEGYVYTKTPAADLESLKKRLEEKIERKRPIPLFRQTWLRAAAVILFVAAGSWLAYNSLSTKNSQVAVETPSQKENTLNRQLSDPVASADSKTDSVQVNNKDKALAVKEKTHNNTQSVAAGTVKAESQFLESNPDTAYGNGLASVNTNDSRTSTDEVSVKQNARTTFKKAEINETASIPAMAPSVNNMNNGRRLNDSGRRTKAYDSMPGAYATMDHLSGTLKKDTITNINVVLKPIALPPAEVVVLDKSSPRDKAAAMAKARPKVIIDTLEPDAGIARFDEYIATNIRTPDELKSKELSGEVQLSFDVNSEGVPTNITVVKSLCEKCDEEAIRLLKEGPKWKKKKNKKGKLTIKF